MTQGSNAGIKRLPVLSPTLDGIGEVTTTAA
jgi:hypothetical protein